MHIFIVLIIIIQSLNIKESKLFQLPITETRHPKSVSDGMTGGRTE